MYRTLNIPLQAIEQAVKSDRLSEAKVYLALKFSAGNGQILLSEINYTKVCGISGFKDVRTVKGHIESLIRLNWLGRCDKWLYIRSLDRFRIETESLTRTAVEVTPDDVRHLLELSLGAKIGHSAKAKRHARKKAGAKPNAKRPNRKNDFSPFDISCSLIGDWYNFSPSTASRLKQRAKALGYFDYRHRSELLPVTVRQLPDYLESMGLDISHVYTKGSRAFIRLTDTFIIGKGDLHTYHFKTRCAV